MRTLIEGEPFEDLSLGVFDRTKWPADWVQHPHCRGPRPVVVAYRRRFVLPAATTVRLHVSADERYHLYLDGRRIGQGPERGAPDRWCFETYDVEMAAGAHVLVARTWWLGPDGPSAWAQMTVRPGFLLAAQNLPAELVNTGRSPWECKPLGGYEFAPPQMTFATPARIRIDAGRFDWGFEHGQGDGWTPAQTIHQAIGA